MSMPALDTAVGAGGSGEGKLDGRVQSVLAKARKLDIRTDPFPHIVIENALDQDLYDRLAAEFPGSEFFFENEQKIANCKALKTGPQSLSSPHATPLWKAFIRHHMSPEFYREFAALFGDLLREYYPDVERIMGKPLEEMSVGPRKPDLIVPSIKHPYDVMLDCQPFVDYTFTARKFRGPHVDSGTEIYAGLLYMREAEDDSTGGALAVWRAKDKARVFPAPRTIRYDPGSAGPAPNRLDLVYEVPYASNTLVLFVNSWRSLHCAQTRSASLLPRRAINIIGEICRYPEPSLFQDDRPGGGKKKPRPSLARRAISLLRRI